MTTLDDAIPVWSYHAEYEELRQQILGACDAVFQSGRLVLGEYGRAFEREMAASVGVAGGVGVNSGTDALFIGLRALGVQPGDEVITVPNTAVPTGSAIQAVGGRPVFVDVGDDCLMDVSKVEAAITPKTKVVVPVHLYGQCVDMDPLLDLARARNVKVLEDVAQAQGALYKGRQAGSMGDAAAFSFYPTKNLGAYGDAGMLLSNDDKLLNLARSLRYYGMETVYYSERQGWNSRLDEVQAAILSLKLTQVERWVERRRAIAARYNTAFSEGPVRPPREVNDRRHGYHLYVVEHPERDRVMANLAERGVGTGICYRWPLHGMRGFAGLGYALGDFPVAEAKADLIFSLPMFPSLSDDEVDRVIEAVRAVG